MSLSIFVAINNRNTFLNYTVQIMTEELLNIDYHITKNSKILIIEDDRTHSFFLRKIFEDLGFDNIEEAQNGKEGLDKTIELLPDLVILDLKMPVMDGFEYCKAVGKHPQCKDVTILAQTGDDEIENKNNIFEVGASDYVTKPIDIKEISARSFVHLRNSYNIKQLILYNERVKEELESARNLIELSLPDDRMINKIKSGYNIDIAAKFESAREIGGDFWGMIPLSENELAIYSLDVSGHGVDSALSALRIQTLLDSNVDQFDNPDEVMKWLNDKLIKLFPVFQFATMFYGVIDFNNNELNYSTSSTTSPIIFKNNCSEYKIIDGKGFPLGVTQNADFKCKKIEFDKNDILVLYSDALIEAVMENGEGFGTKRLIDLLNKSFKRGAGKDMSVALNFVLNEFHSQCGSLLEDDLTVNFYKRIS